MALTQEDLAQIRSIFAEELVRYHELQEQRVQARRLQDAEREAVKRTVVEALHAEGDLAFASVIAERTALGRGSVLDALAVLERDGLVLSTKDPGMNPLYRLKEAPANAPQPG